MFSSRNFSILYKLAIRTTSVPEIIIQAERHPFPIRSNSIGSSLVKCNASKSRESVSGIVHISTGGFSRIICNFVLMPNDEKLNRPTYESRQTFDGLQEDSDQFGIAQCQFGSQTELRHLYWGEAFDPMVLHIGLY